MTQTTRVLQVDDATARRLETALQAGLPTAEWRRVPHARFALKADGVVATCYTSGKLVLQGRDLDAFVARFLDGVAEAAPRARSGVDDPDLAFDRPTVASDETGKGDFFGPLVVAAVRADPTDDAALAKLGVADSKTLTDDRARRIAGAIEALLPHAVVSLTPADYNARHAEVGNINRMLAVLHAEALARVIAARPGTEIVIVDRFGAEQLVASELRQRTGLDLPLLQVPRAERHRAVAAASILARAAFLDGLRACEEACGSDLHKGAGAPVDVAARRVVRIGGRELLATVAKLHFKNTARALG